ncbi:MFS transporter [Quadrisphaera oryzae]|uniref:MFS transporter n=1 Tax=Quadrisphaera TaxID=317661 RepID=UPI0016463C03|nr:MFS transporter [Quadrisphaera sp. RL12-1S]MBC3760748.1 MFS transporter [Quadrisphaera sp. RL12-1S]
MTAPGSGPATGPRTAPGAGRAPALDAETSPSPAVRLVLTTVFLAYLAQLTLNPVLAPLSREVGLAEWQVGATISTAALMVALTSSAWGRRSQSRGRKPVLAAALGLGAASSAAFALAVWLGTAGLLAGAVLFVLFVLLRGVAFGAAIAAVAPTAQAFIADVTHDEAARVKGMAGVGAVQGVAMLAGSVAGGALSAVGLLAPVVAVPVLLLAAVLLVVTRMPRQEATALVAEPARLRVRDPRVLPFLVAGFGMFTALGFIQVVTGFIVQDRLALDAATTGLVTGGVLLAAGVGMVLAQVVVVPRSGWRPATLLRVGDAVALLGYALLVPDLGLVGIVVSVLLVGLGLGTAMPGFTAGPTLLVARHEQGGVAGLVAATTGLTFVVAPLAGTTLYGLWPPLAPLAGVVVMAAVTLFVVVHPRFRAPRS